MAAGFSVRRHFDAPQELVFELASDFAGAQERISGITKVEMLTDGPASVGTRFRETRVMFGREATEEMEVTAFEPPHRYALLAESHGCRYHSELRFTPSGGGTDVEMAFEGTPLTTAAKVMAFLMRPFMGKMAEACGKDLDDLKTVAEARSGRAEAAEAGQA